MENQKVRLTKTTVAEAAPADREYILWDSRVPGFGLRVRPTGGKSYIFAYRTSGGRAGKSRRVTIKANNPEVAFEEAKKLSGQHHGGVDPAGGRSAEKEALEAARATLSVADTLDRFVADHAKERLAEKTWREYERIADKLLKPALGETKVDALAPKDVAGFYHAHRAKPTQAALAVRVLSSAMSWAEENGLRPAGSNPARIRLKGSRRRQRLFSEAEVARLQAAIGTLENADKITATVAMGLRLLFATGCRAGEICGLRWSGVDTEAGVLMWSDSKTGYLEKPLTDEARGLLKRANRIVGVDWVCPGANPEKPLRVETLEAGFERVMAEAKVEAGENATLHLIRHWFATKTYTDKDIPLPVQMAIVGHKSVATAMRYAHTDRGEVQRAAAGAAKRRTAAVNAAAKRGKVVALEAAR